MEEKKRKRSADASSEPNQSSRDSTSDFQRDHGRLAPNDEKAGNGATSTSTVKGVDTLIQGTNEIHEGTSSKKRRKNNDGNNGDLDKVNTSKTESVAGGVVDSKTREVAPGTDEHQRATWSTLQTNLHELISNLTPQNLVETLPKVFSLNLIRGRGHFVNEMLKTQMARKGKEVDGAAKLFASLTSVINTKLPQVGELLVNTR